MFQVQYNQFSDLLPLILNNLILRGKMDGVCMILDYFPYISTKLDKTNFNRIIVVISIEIG